MKFDRRFFSNLLVFILLIVIGIVISTFQANNSVELVDVPNLGELADGKNRPELQSGLWKNDIWGEYHLVFNPNATNCIVAHLQDGQTYVFNHNTNEATAECYREFLTHLPQQNK